MKLPDRRSFLHLAAERCRAAGSVAVREGASLSDAHRSRSSSGFRSAVGSILMRVLWLSGYRIGSASRSMSKTAPAPAQPLPRKRSCVRPPTAIRRHRCECARSGPLSEPQI